jgi:regulator of protease activity HflC (stomatin/prohibitin superfamily)
MSILKHTLMVVTLHRLIPEQHVVIVERDGLANRLEGPGYVRINPFSEEFGPQIRLGPQPPVELSLNDVRSADGDIFDLQLTILYGFDPRRCNLQKTPGLVRNAPGAQAGILKRSGQQIVHEVMGEFSSLQLRSGGTRGEIEQRVKSRLHHTMLFAGVQLYNIVIDRLTPPQEWEAALRANREKQVRVETTVQEREKLASVEAQETRVRAEAEAFATKLLSKAGITEKELLFKLFAAMDPELVKQLTNTEVFSKLAANGGSVNLMAPLAAQLSSFLLPLLAQQHIFTDTISLTNGKVNGTH